MPQPPVLQPADLAVVDLFADLAPERLAQLLEQHRCVAFAAEQLLVLEQDESQGVFLLRSGLAKVRSIDHNGEETVLAVLGPGDVCGEMALLAPGGRRSADVVSLVACTAVVLRAAPFAAVLQSEPALALALARLLARRLQALNQRFRLLRSADATSRLLAALVELAQHSTAGAPATAPIPPLPQRELAALAGLARETASRTLSKLRERGTVRNTEEGGLLLADLEPLHRRGLL